MPFTKPSTGNPPQCPTTSLASGRLGKRPPAALWGLLFLALGLTGCAPPPRTPVVFFLDGAGNFGYAGRVRWGLRQGGYSGRFEPFVWSSFLGPAVDHLVVARAGGRADGLARRIEAIRQTGDDGPIHLLGLSAGTAVLVTALGRLEDGVMVDNVVLLSASMSARRDLIRALPHVRGHVYATVSRRDRLLSLMTLNADGGTGPPAGREGIQLPDDVAPSERRLYCKVVNLPWKPAYAAWGWDGGHTSVTAPNFIEHVIAPRLRRDGGLPLDRPVYLPPRSRR